MVVDSDRDHGRPVDDEGGSVSSVVEDPCISPKSIYLLTAGREWAFWPILARVSYRQGQKRPILTRNVIYAQKIGENRQITPKNSQMHKPTYKQLKSITVSLSSSSLELQSLSSAPVLSAEPSLQAPLIGMSKTFANTPLSTAIARSSHSYNNKKINDVHGKIQHLMILFENSRGN